MRFWKFILVLLLATGYGAYYYKVPAKVYASLQALNFKPSGFESDTVRPPAPKRPATSVREFTAAVTRVVDGDTIVIDTGQKVRYIGINTPESVDPRKPVQCFGAEASARNKALVEAKEVKLVKDVSETDKYGRLLRYVYLADGTFVNLELVKEGYARVDTFPPDVKFSKEFVAADKAARLAQKGLWSACK